MTDRNILTNDVVRMGRLWEDGAYTDRQGWVKAEEYARLDADAAGVQAELASVKAILHARNNELTAARLENERLREALGHLLDVVSPHEKDRCIACQQAQQLLENESPADEPSVRRPPDGTMDGDGVWKGGLWFPNVHKSWCAAVNPDPCNCRNLVQCGGCEAGLPVSGFEHIGQNGEPAGVCERVRAAVRTNVP